MKNNMKKMLSKFLNFFNSYEKILQTLYKKMLLKRLSEHSVTLPLMELVGLTLNDQTLRSLEEGKYVKIIVGGYNEKDSSFPTVIVTDFPEESLKTILLSSL